MACDDHGCMCVDAEWFEEHYKECDECRLEEELVSIIDPAERLEFIMKNTGGE